MIKDINDCMLAGISRMIKTSCQLKYYALD